MDSATKSRLARLGEVSKEAAGARLRAARKSIGMSQIELGDIVGRRKTAISNMENAGAFVSVEVMSYLFREHRIDFNFIIAGQYAQLPGDVQDRLFSALADAGTERVKTPN